MSVNTVIVKKNKPCCRKLLINWSYGSALASESIPCAFFYSTPFNQWEDEDKEGGVV